MRLMRCGAVALAVVLAVAAMPARGADTAYPIKLARASKVGDAYDVQHTIEAVSSSTATPAGSPPQIQSQTIKAELQGSCVVTEVDAHGLQRGLKLTVKKFSVGDARDAVAPGMVIAITRGEKDSTFVVAGGEELSADVKNALTIAYPPLPKSEITDDDAIGSKTPRKVGESWPINADAAAQQATQSGVEVDAKKITGSSVLKAVEKVNGGEALRIVTDITATGVKPPNLPNGISVDSSELKSHSDCVVPTDEKLTPVENTDTMDIHLSCSSAGATGMKLEIKSHITDKTTFSVVKK